MTKTFEISLELKSKHQLDDELSTVVFEAFADGTPWSAGEGLIVVDIDREAKSLGEALESVAQDALANIDRLGPVGFMADELVSVGNIAEDLELSRDTVHKHMRGERGKGGFPAPIAGDKWKLYSKRAVQRYFADNGHGEAPEIDEASERFIDTIQRILDIAAEFAALGESGKKEAQRYGARLKSARKLLNAA